ncbi:hypothetical protein E2C01_037200 [Portunus trituberculatus]|uniref:Uncharacterized protein n=1 Tax=Portunus trituberculatus TaxID=210409 RepID=A0A5B7F7H6_PORTR|nr:hypothetical protein [Portunus trituberculatus]
MLLIFHITDQFLRLSSKATVLRLICHHQAVRERMERAVVVVVMVILRWHKSSSVTKSDDGDVERVVLERNDCFVSR